MKIQLMNWHLSVKDDSIRIYGENKTMEFSINEYRNYNESEILNLYQSVGWISYTNNPKMLENAYANSLKILGVSGISETGHWYCIA